MIIFLGSKSWNNKMVSYRPESFIPRSFLFLRYLSLAERHFLSDIAPFPDSSDLYSRSNRTKDIKMTGTLLHITN